MDTAVLVVGAGPTGMMLAAELALAGTDVILVERDDEPSPQSRGGGVSARTAEVLAMRGLIDAVRSHEIPRDGAGAHFAGLPVPLDARPWRTRHPDGVLVPQNRLSAILEARLGEHGVAVRRGSGLTGLTAGRRRGHGHARRRRVGAGSLPRRLRRRPQHRPHAARRAVPGTQRHDVRGQRGHRPRLRGRHGRPLRHPLPHLAAQRGWLLDDPAPLDGEAGGVDGYRVVFGGGPAHPPAAREAPVTPDEVASALTAVHGPETVLGGCAGARRFSDASRQLAAYRHGRVLFAGDAAHIHLPVGGQGLNLGIQDAVNLGWKLAATVPRRAPDGLLDSYHAERHPVAARVLATVRAQGVIMNLPPEADDVRALRDIVADLARLPDANRYLAGLMSGLALRYDLGDQDPFVGTRMIDLSLRTADGPTTVSELLRNGRGLLLELGRPGPTTVEGVVDHVTAEVLDSPVGTDLPARRVLVRPDGYVCWASDDPAASPGPACAAGSASRCRTAGERRTSVVRSRRTAMTRLSRGDASRPAHVFRGRPTPRPGSRTRRSSTRRARRSTAPRSPRTPRAPLRDPRASPGPRPRRGGRSAGRSPGR